MPTTTDESGLEIVQNGQKSEDSGSELKTNASSASGQEVQPGQVEGDGWAHLLGNNGMGMVKYPLLFVAPSGIVSVLLQHDVIVEISIDRAIRVVCHDKFAAVSDSGGSSSAIIHEHGRMFQEDTKVYCSFAGEKLAVFGSAGVLFTMGQLPDAFFVSMKVNKGTGVWRRSQLEFPNIEKTDFTLKVFYRDAQAGKEALTVCDEIAQSARYERRDDGHLSLVVNGVHIRQSENGDVDVTCRPRHFALSPTRGTVNVRTHFVDMAVEEEGKCYVKRGVKRVHVSCSGMVVSDGNCTTAMDHTGRIVSSS